ncbi:hypothetical protein B0H16DRAFT_1686939 [Mycena metata]|uniref:F-box domain-containing protein n=1 Tax=Mycena metata TaxID=1033252 RepID=A0AAD7JMW8_9AGAR|nr:hypothetical protein B0H16DRAFT_1686939 [Mycena metata]
MDDLPPELLELIFLQCHAAVEICPTLTDAPINLSATCKRWRHIASDIPSLWSMLKVVASHTVSGPPLEVVAKWLRLSGSHPLSLCLVCRPHTARAVEEGRLSSDLGVFKVLELFLLNMYRWRAVSFDFSQYAPPINYPSSLTAQGAPQLERFEIQPFSWSPLLGALNIPWLAAVVSAPLLHSFTSHLGKFPSAFFSRVPWGQLTYLRLETRLSEFACLFILQSASNLIECYLLNVRHEFVEDVPAFDPLLPAVLPHLRTLGVASQVGFDRLFRLLVAPSLQTLEIATRSTQMRWDHTQFMAFLRRSACSITSLTLRDLFISRLADAELREVLTHISDSLTSLAITSDIPGTPVGIQNTLLRGLAYRPTGRVLCPQLENLVLQIGAFVSDGELGRTVESRWTGHSRDPARIARLHNVDIVCATDTHTLDIQELHRLFEQGLQGRVRMLNTLQNEVEGPDRRRDIRRRSLA